MDYGRPERAEALAAEYAAGTLRGPARRRFEALLPGHPALQAAVRRWQARLMPLSGVLPPQPPPARVWRAIEQRLWPAPQAEPWWRRLALWRTVAALGSVATLSLAVLLANPPGRPAAGAPVLVVLQATGEGGRPGGVAGGSFVASVAADGGALVARPVVPVALAPDRAFELWSVPPQGAPVSLGLIRADGVTVLRRERLPAGLLKGGTAALAVSLEPPGGSPTGAPTGPVVFAGRLQL